MIKAIIFDFDGTIVDTESPWFDLVLELYREYNHELPLSEYLKCIGTNDDEFDVYLHLERLLGHPIDRDGIKRKLSARHGEIMKAASLRPGVLAIIQAAHTRGIRLAIASSSPSVWVKAFLQQFQIADYFPVIVTADDVEKVKPDPALFNLARAGLATAPEETLIFEDSCYGLEAAQAAGIKCVAVHNRVTVAMDFTGAVRVYGEFNEFDLDEVLTL